MHFPSRLFRKTSALSVMVVMGALSVAVTPQIATAGGCDGLNLFSGVERKDQLTCRLDFGGASGGTDRYRFRLDKKKMKSEKRNTTHVDNEFGNRNAKNYKI